MLSRNNNNNNNRNNNHSSKRSNSNHLSSSSSSSPPQRPPRNDHSVEVKVEEDVSSSFREEHKLGDTNNHTHSTSYDPHHHHHHPALIYAAPTVDTLGDDESTLCPAPFATPKRTTTPANNHNHNHNITQRKKSNHHHHHHRNNNNTHNCHSKQPSPKDFQVEQDSMAVFVRTIPVAERLAFDNVPSLQPPHVLLLNKRQQKCSPSLQHLRLLKTLQSQTHLSQLSFRPSVSLASDIIGDTTSSTTSTHVVRDGRYRSIDPVQATLLRLPPNPPLLSNKKHRLPMRADVGFANTPADEMQQKQLEIQQETAWEEASPRLVVLVTSDDLGTAVESESMPPFVGPELRQAKERNHVHFDRSIPPPPRASSSAPSPPLANNNNTSMLAPPLDATYSASMGWRPRPFYDRPPGMKYVLVSPLKLEFETGPLEPLIGSLTLYRLDNNNNNNNGKASEAFYFPAGDWNGRLAANNHANHANMATTAETKVWMERAHKAIFSYDPLVLHHPQQLYVVLQVSKVTHLELAAAYLAGKKTSSSQQQQQQQPSTTSSFRKRWKQHFRGAGGVKADDAEKTRYRSNTVWDSHGTQFVSPLCFGVTPLFPNQQKQQASWPKGDVQQHVPLYCYPPQSESQEQFCQRLSAIVSRLNNNSSNGGQWNTTGPLQSQQQSLSTLYEPSSSSSSVDNQSVTSNSMESAEFASPNKKKSLRFRISPKKLSPKINSNSTTKRSKKDGLATNPKQQQQQQPLQDTPILKANVCLFTSALPVDFLQSMLQTPPEIRNRSSTLPKILVDASGESAIMMDPKTKATTDGSSSNPQKRSNLLRLPPRKGGYSDACDFREVLFLPPRPSPKQYDVVDVAAAPPLYKSILNLLYLYPRMLLRLEKNNHNNSSKGNKRQQRYTIRIRLVQQNLAETSNHSNSSSTPMIESSNTVLESFHNPTPWAGPSLLKTVYTKIPGDTTFSNSKQQLQYDDLKAGIPLKDEFKMKLPMVLDGNYFLHFKLFAVEFQDDLDDSASVSVDGSVTEDAACGISTRSLAETTIPLVSSSIRDPKSGVKATTIIPNGCHRLRLGDFQLQMETRLLSSIHVADPVVATALRDFPFCHSDEALSGERLSELALVTKRTVVSRQDSRGGDSSASVASTMPGKVPYSTLFATASGSALVAHFQPLLFMHLSNLVNVRSSNGNRGPEASEKFLMENAQSFLEICRRVKTTFLSSHPDGQKRFAAFIKTTMDSFDEGFLHSSNPKEDLSDDDSASEVMPVEHSRSNPSTNPSVSGEDEKDDEFDGGAIRRRKKSLRSGIDIRISKTFSAMEQSEKAPFSRVAYGATKTDRMRLEAELDVENSRFSHLADDDETVVTLATTLTGEARMAEAREAFEKTRLSSPKSFHKEDNSEANSLKEGSRSEDSHGIDFGAYQRSISELAFTKRVRSAAQVMLAPCGTANLSAVFSSPRNAASKSETKDEAQSESSKPSIKSQLPDHSVSRQLAKLEALFGTPPAYSDTIFFFLFMSLFSTGPCFVDAWFGHRRRRLQG